jgi:hypothetical protein
MKKTTIIETKMDKYFCDICGKETEEEVKCFICGRQLCCDHDASVPDDPDDVDYIVEYCCLQCRNLGKEYRELIRASNDEQFRLHKERSEELYRLWREKALKSLEDSGEK